MRLTFLFPGGLCNVVPTDHSHHFHFAIHDRECFHMVLIHSQQSCGAIFVLKAEQDFLVHAFCNGRARWIMPEASGLLLRIGIRDHADKFPVFSDRHGFLTGGPHSLAGGLDGILRF